MANASAKKIVKQNAIKLVNLRSYAFIVNLIYIVIRFLFYSGLHLSMSSWIMFTLVNIVFLGCFVYLSNLAHPSFDSGGNLTGSGEDLNGNNLTAYVFDIIYIGWFATLGSLISSNVWYIYLGGLLV